MSPLPPLRTTAEHGGIAQLAIPGDQSASAHFGVGLTNLVLFALVFGALTLTRRRRDST